MSQESSVPVRYASNLTAVLNNVFYIIDVLVVERWDVAVIAGDVDVHQG